MNLIGFLGLAGIFNFISLYLLAHAADGSGIILGHFRWLRLIEMLPFTLFTLAWVGVALAAIHDRGYTAINSFAKRISEWLAGRRIFSILGLFACIILAPPVMTVLNSRLQNVAPMLWVIVFLAAVGGVFLSALRPTWPWGRSFLLLLLGMGIVYIVLTNLATVSRDPISHGWSESSQYYFASTFLSKFIYGFWTPLPVINPSYELLMSLPYIIQGLPLWAHRLWTALLWIGFTWGAASALALNFKDQPFWKRALLFGWAFIFIQLIPVYFHLLACVFLVLLGFSTKNKTVRWGSVIVASIWAGISRINWFPMPGALAAVLYILENPMGGKGWRYWIPPFLWVLVGTGLAFGTDALYILGSRNPAYYFEAHFTQSLLWYRLLPSATSGTGILLNLLIFGGPVVAAILVVMARMGWPWRIWRLLGLLSVLLVFLLGGLLVSAKIGGGNNIHNLDAFLTLVMVIASYLAFDRFAPDQVIRTSLPAIPGWAIAMAAGIPILVTLPFQTVRFQFNSDPGEHHGLVELQQIIDETQRDHPGQDILFLSERQLVTFDTVHGVRLVPDYEKWFLMEMSMGGNAKYFASFDRDLANHRFSLIVSEPLNTKQQTSEDTFGEENDAWVKWVSQPILENYTSIKKYDGEKIELFIPKSK